MTAALRQVQTRLSFCPAMFPCISRRAHSPPVKAAFNRRAVQHQQFIFKLGCRLGIYRWAQLSFGVSLRYKAAPLQMGFSASSLPPTGAGPRVALFWVIALFLAGLAGL